MESGIEKFEKLPESKRKRVMNAAVEVFGRYDYSYASTELIATKAKISKSLLFFYFGNKSKLYMYTLQFIASTIISGVVDDKLAATDDFFEAISYAARRKVAVISEFPALLDFAVKAFYPQGQGEKVQGQLDAYMENSISTLPQQYFTGVNWGKFRDDVDPKEILSMLVWMTDGYIHERQRMGKAIDIDGIMTEFGKWCAMYKRIAYKEEYL
ncbi:MAG: TetR/AcrR family transcriptional regulator [Bifidobacteriaceae bacterium]|jgi:AcrR family transcriptional regulator|nr:TetR/AcrR family transcriptional regulator [Bifidobacteriaceae bacterium]